MAKRTDRLVHFFLCSSRCMGGFLSFQYHLIFCWFPVHSRLLPLHINTSDARFGPNWGN